MLHLQRDVGFWAGGDESGPLLFDLIGTDAVTSLGGRRLTKTTSNNYATGRSARGRSAGKWYFEAVKSAGPVGSSSGAIIGLCQASQNLGSNPSAALLGLSGPSYGYASWNGFIYFNGNQMVAGSTWSDRVGCAVDLTAKKIWFHNGGTWQFAGSNPATGAGGTNLDPSVFDLPMFAACGVYAVSPADSMDFIQAGSELYKPAGFLSW
ncbi:SPRY domain-containing protein [Caulobacter sp. NIBR2454]|uniref:SPRY domain-containing protein n=1 Tax=Caulobacter sp. NIBR2454 TaxID=3015996 RepID=UPI0022B72326|nr:SPRY domain-containing protein [Caulobacter sp. NIBR2454]